jgi:hypothetical protein
MVSALFCLMVWVAPHAIGANAFKLVVAMMAVEFLLIHGAVIFGVIAGATANTRRWLRWSILAMPLLVYLAFLIPVARSIGQWWPLSVFIWMIYSKVQAGSDPRAKESVTWLFSVTVFMTAVFGTALLPLPRLGFTPELVAQLAVSSSGTWAEKPQSLVAAMLSYYAALCIYKWRAGGKPPVQFPRGKKR